MVVKKLFSLITAMVIGINSLNPVIVAQANDSLPSTKVEEGLRIEDRPRVIIELKEDSILENANKMGIKVDEMSKESIEKQTNELEFQKDEVKEKLEKEGIEIEEIDTLNLSMNAIVAEVDSEDLDKIASNNNIEKIWKSNQYYKPRPYVFTSTDLIGSSYAHMPNVGFKGEGMVIGVIDSGLDVDSPDMKISQGVDIKLNEEKVKSIKHNSKDNRLHGSYINEKIPYAYDYADFDTDVRQNVKEQHGMHVAGIIAGNGNIKGVAPEAQLLALKVFSDDFDLHTVYFDRYLAAIEDAILLGADVLNLSFGAPAGIYDRSKDNLEEKTFEKARENGIVVVVAAGNERNFINGWGEISANNPDQSLISTPSLFPSTISVASLENARKIDSLLKVSDENGSFLEFETNILNSKGSKSEVDIIYLTDEDLQIEELTDDSSEKEIDILEPKDNLIDDTSTEDSEKDNADDHTNVKDKDLENPSDDSANPSSSEDDLEKPSDGLDDQSSNKEDLKNNEDNKFLEKAVLIDNLDNVSDLYNKLEELGAEALIIINEEENIKTKAISENKDLPVLFIKNSDGQKLKSSLEEGKKISVDIISESFINNSNIGEISRFSSWGPTTDLRIKPEIVAPGSYIYSSQNDGRYTEMSGTSMAAPHVAGASALMMQKLKADGIESRNLAELTKLNFMNTADPIINNDDGYTYSVMQQGAGKLDLEGAIKNNVLAYATGTNDEKEDGVLEIKEVNGSFEANIKIVNNSNKPATYDINVEGLKEEINENNIYTEKTKPVNIKFEGPKKITVKENSSEIVKLNINYDGVEDNQFINGFITLNSFENEDLSIPFLGFHGNWNQPRIFDGMKLYGEYSEFNLAKMTDSSYYMRDLQVKEIDGENYYIYNPSIGIMPHITRLRTTEFTQFSILDENGKQLRTLSTYHGMPKDFRMSKEAKPVYNNMDMAWDGMIEGKPTQEGQKYIYKIDAKLNYDSDYQTYEYKLTPDATAPRLERYSLTGNTLRLKVSDNMAGTENIAIYNPEDEYGKYNAIGASANPNFDYENNTKIKDITDFKEGSYIEIELTEELRGIPLAIYLEDKVGNSVEEILDIKAKEDIQDKPYEDPGYKDNGAPKITMTAPNPDSTILTDDEGVLIRGIIHTDKDPEKILVEQLDPTTGKVVATTDDVEYEISSFWDSTAAFFKSNLKLDEDVNGQINIRVTVTIDGKTSNIVHRFYIDKTPPTIEYLGYELIGDNEAELTFRIKDDTSYLTVYRRVDNADSEYPVDVDQVYVHDDTRDTTLIKETDITFKTKVNLDEKYNVFKFVVYDQASHLRNEDENSIVEVIIDLEDVQSTEPKDDNKENNNQFSYINRLAGSDRIKTAIEVSKEAFVKSDNILLVNGYKEADALSASTLAHKLDAPILLVEKDVICEEVIDEINRLEAKNITIVGGPDSISEKSLAYLDKFNVNRISGEDRFETSVKIANKIGYCDKLIIANGYNIVDALASSPLAIKESRSIILTQKSEIPKSAKTIIDNSTDIIIVGGEASISEEIKKEINDKNITRIYGLDRFETSTKIAERLGENQNSAALVNGYKYADALAVGSVSKKLESPILLIKKDEIPKSVKNYIDNEKIERILIIGGYESIDKIQDK